MSIGTITVDLVAKTGSFETDLNRAQKQADKSAKAIDKSFRDAGTAIGAGLAAGAIAAVAIANSAINTLGDLDDAAQKTGSSVENLSRLQQTASAFGADFGSVNDALIKLSKGMASVDDETNKTNKALAALGVSSKDASGALRDPSEVLTDIAQNLQGYQDGAAKAALATDLFGKAGANLLPYLNDLAESGEKFTGVTADAAKQAANFQDQLGIMKTQFASLTQTIVGEALPGLTKFVQGINAANESSNGLLSTFGRIISLNVGRIFGKDAGAQLKMNQSLDESDRKFLQRVQQQEALAGAYAKSTDKLDRLAQAASAPKVLNYTTGTEKSPKSSKAPVDKQTDADKYLESLEKQVITVQNLTTAEEALAKIQAGQLGKVTEDQQNQILSAATLVDLQKDQIEKGKILQKQQEDGKKIYEDTRTPIESLGQELTKLQELLDAGVIDWDTYARATFAAQDAFDKLGEKSKETRSALDEFAANAAKNIQNSFANFLFDPLDGGFKGMVQGFATALRRMAADAVAADLARQLFGSTSTGSNSDSSGLLGSLFKNGINAIGSYFSGKATGGSVSGGQTFLVGEEGPELFKPNSAGTILPNDSLVGGGGVNVTIPQTINVDARSDQASIRQAMAIASDSAVSRVKQEIRRGGDLARLTGKAS